MKDEELITAAFTKLKKRAGYHWKWQPDGNDLDRVDSAALIVLES